MRKDEAALEEAHELYRRGDYRGASPLYEALAARGNVEAQLILGGMYQHGLGVEQNLEAARAWYGRADALGSVVGTYYLATVQRAQGRYAQAVECFKKASGEGYPPALYRLGKMYFLGEGVPRDREKAYEYLERAARRGHLFAQRDAAWRLVIGRGGLRRIPEGIWKYFESARAAAEILRTNPHDDRVR